MPSTVSCVLSFVMQTWLGTSSGISFSECLYASRSTNGTRKLSPGVSVPWYLPSRSTTQAFCCGTTLIARTTKVAAMTTRTRATMSILFSFQRSSSSLLPSTPRITYSPAAGTPLPW